MNALSAYHRELVAIYSFAIEVDSALMMWHNQLNKIVDGPSGTTASNSMFFGKGDPNDPATQTHHARTFAYMINASAHDGIYAKQLRWSAIVRLYSVWEDRFRHQIANECGLTKNDIRGNAHGDLRSFRHAIVHKGGQLDEEPTALRYFTKGESLLFSNGQMIDLFRQLTAKLNVLGVRHYGADPGLSLTVV